MTRFAVFADVHANLPALQGALAEVRRLGVDGILFLGDSIAIGPHPAECLGLLLAQQDLVAVLGNHDAWLAHGLPQPRPEWMSVGEVEHQEWTHSRISNAQWAAVKAWPFEMSLDVEGVHLYLSHYALAEGGHDWQWLGRTPTVDHFDAAYERTVGTASVCLFGHDHMQRDTQGRARYINPGALGCNDAARANFGVLSCQAGAIRYEHLSVSYDDTSVLTDYERLRVPERDFLRRTFHGGR